MGFFSLSFGEVIFYEFSRQRFVDAVCAPPTFPLFLLSRYGHVYHRLDHPNLRLSQGHVGGQVVHRLPPPQGQEHVHRPDLQGNLSAIWQSAQGMDAQHLIHAVLDTTMMIQQNFRVGVTEDGAGCGAKGVTTSELPLAMSTEGYMKSHQSSTEKTFGTIGNLSSSFFCRMRLYNSLRQGRFSVKDRKTTYLPVKLGVCFKVRRATKIWTSHSNLRQRPNSRFRDSHRQTLLLHAGASYSLGNAGVGYITLTSSWVGKGSGNLFLLRISQASSASIALTKLHAI